MKRKELFWMLIPCLLFGIVYFARQRINPPFTLRAVYEGKQEVPLTPREVAEGYDTKVSLNLRSTGEASSPFGTEFVGSSVETDSIQLLFGSPPVPVPNTALPPDWLTVYGPTLSEDRRKNACLLLLKLAAVPTRYNPLFLEVRCKVQALYRKPKQDFPPFTEIFSPTITVVTSVRDSGEIIRPPHVSRDPEMSLKQVLLDEKSFHNRFKSYKLSKNDVRLEVTFHPHIKDETDMSFNYLNCISAEVLDEQGKVCATISDEDLIAVGVFGEAEQAGQVLQPEGSQDAIMSLHLPLSTIPSSRGQLTFRGRFCADQRWPVTLSVIVREKDKRVPTISGKKQPVILRPPHPHLKVE